jgi:hypothetical protein
MTKQANAGVCGKGPDWNLAILEQIPPIGRIQSKRYLGMLQISEDGMTQRIGDSACLSPPEEKCQKLRVKADGSFTRDKKPWGAR